MEPPAYLPEKVMFRTRTSHFTTCPFLSYRGILLGFSGLGLANLGPSPDFERTPVTVESGMKKADLAKRMARVAKVSSGEAADRLDRAVRDILSDLRQGKETVLPGLGRFTHGANGQVVFLQERGDRHE